MSTGRSRYDRILEDLTLPRRFWEKVRLDDACWEWTAFCHPRSGYGMVRVAGEGMVSAPRVMWEWVNGPMPDGMCVCHSCDNPPCIRPSHLWLGTQGDNMSDMVEKGRQGRRVGNRKLTPAQVGEIRLFAEVLERCHWRSISA